MRLSHALAALAALVLAAGLAAPATGTPIPQDPGAASVTAYLGHPAKAHPIHRGSFAPRHPFMARNNRSNLHDDAYQSDAGMAPGPLGRHPEVLSNQFNQECASVTFDTRGRLLTVCVGVVQVTLRLLDPDTLDVLAEYQLPPRQTSSAQNPFTAFGGGGYFYLDQHDRVVVPTSEGTIQVIKETGTPAAPTLMLARTYDVSQQVGSSVILSALPDWRGRIWYVTGAGKVGVINRRTGRARARDLHEGIGNSIAVDEDRHVYVVTNKALYQLRTRHSLRPRVVWRVRYDGGTRQKPGQSQPGSGTTPTIIRRGGHHFVAITDNADPRMHVLVYRADRAPRRPFCKVPVFAKRHGDTDNSLIAVANGIIVENNYGYTGPEMVPPSGDPARNTPTTRPGITRVDVNYARRTCHKAWTNHRLRVPSSVSKVSAATGLLYVYDHPSAEEVRYDSGSAPVTGPEDPWYLTAVNARTGKRVWSRMTGVGLGYNNNYAPITLGPDGTAYVGVLGGIVAVRDR